MTRSVTSNRRRRARWPLRRIVRRESFSGNVFEYLECGHRRTLCLASLPGAYHPNMTHRRCKECK